MTQEFIDNRQVHVKLLTIAGMTRFVTVLPPGPIEHDDTVWAHKRQSDDAAIPYHGPDYDGLLNYTRTKMELA